MACIAQIVSLATGEPFPLPMFIFASDLYARDGAGTVMLTNDDQAALRFKSVRDGLFYVMRQSKVKPLREDGLPNRPLRAFTIEFVEV